MCIEKNRPKTDRTKKGAREISLSINEKYNSNIHPRRVEKLVQEIIIDETPPKRGPTNGIPENVYKKFVWAFESYVHIKEVNGHDGEVTRKKLMSKVNNVAAIGNDVRDSACILNPLI